jgi:outer membrane protein TolC
MAVILIAHSKVEPFTDPEVGVYDRYSPRLHKHAAAVVSEWADGILFATRRIAVQNAVQEQALIAYEKSLLTSFEDVENALTAYAVGRERVAARQKAAESARRANDLARTLYQAGAADFQKVLDTDRTRLTAEETLASADADLLTAVIQLYKALGGGWQNAST